MAEDDTATVLEDGVVTIDVLANDSDVEDVSPDPATVAIEAADDAGGQVKTVAGEGVWNVVLASGAITFTPEPDYAGPVTPIAYTVADSEGLRSAPAAVSVTITAVNDAPVAEDDTATVLEDGVVTIDVLANDSDVEDVSPDPATVAIEAADDAGGQVKTVAGEGVWSVDPASGAITFTPEPDYAGPVTPIAYTVADSEGLRSAPAAVSVTITAVNDGPNSIVLENEKPGVLQSIWDADSSNQIEGFTTDISYDTGDLVSFKINVNATGTVPYRIEVYRLGYYGGDGATLVTTLDNLTGTPQPDPIQDARGLVDAGNWSVSANWQTSEDAVSGVYLAKLVREDNGATNQIPFILREDDLRSRWQQERHRFPDRRYHLARLQWLGRPEWANRRQFLRRLRSTG